MRIGSRGSKLALAQTHWVRDRILNEFPEARLEIRVIKTSADRDVLMPIRSAPGRGVFVKEIEEALMAGAIDLAIHSMKDMPTRIPDPLQITVIPAREDARDALLCKGGAMKLRSLPRGAVVGTGSIRRQAQVLAERPDLAVVDIRGNVDTRLEKLRAGKYDAIVLACAGLNRLGLQDRISAPLEFSEMLPASGQGALALETRKDDERMRGMLLFLHDPPTERAVLAERAFMRRIGGGCNSPVAVHALPADGGLRIEGLVASPDGARMIRESILAPPNQTEDAASALADRILSQGGDAILRSTR